MQVGVSGTLRSAQPKHLYVYFKVLSCFACWEISALPVALKALQPSWRIACFYLQMSGAGACCNRPQNMGGSKYFYMFDEILSLASRASVAGR